MTTVADRVKAVAKALIVGAGMSHAVAATDVRAAATKLHGEYANYSVVDITTRISSEIKASHRPGISGKV